MNLGEKGGQNSGHNIHHHVLKIKKKKKEYFDEAVKALILLKLNP